MIRNVAFKIRRFRCLSVIKFIFPFIISFCASPQVDSFHYTGIADDSNLTLEGYKKEADGIVPDYNGWKITLQKVFLKLAPESKVSLFILKKDSFNMGFFPENDFVIHTGTLSSLDREIPKLQSDTSLLKNCTDKNSCREMLIAPIIAHELSHYFQEDSKRLKEKYADYKNLPEDDFSERILAFKREREFAADTFAASLLAKHKYKPELILLPIKILKQINQERNKNPKERIDYYLKSHPSPNERLAHLDTKESYKNLQELEKAFHLIANGTDRDTLKYALSIIERQLLNFPENLELERARVTALHRYWMYTATPSDLKYIAVIDQPLFSDAEEFNTSKGAKKIPGDENVYRKTLSLYQELFDKLKLLDFGFVSNYAILLAYSDDEDNRKKSLALALDAFKNTKTFKTFNNLGVVYALNNQIVDGIKTFWTEIPESEKKNIDNTVSIGGNQSNPINSERVNTIENISFQFEENLPKESEKQKGYHFISIANYTLAKFHSSNEEDKKDAFKLREKYFYRGDNPSPWVQYINNEIAQIK